ncbi:hypothetical protein E4U35_006894 [Claviceps purpurea]|nr:hypothetical protein E4U35_006894 [Claviceps purpurea]KAG6244297.1 hypothetical protein E4U25_000029 [Claviceps purpurea]
MDISSFPTDIWNLVIEQLVIIVGIKNAVLLRRTNKAFDAAIMKAICIAQVVDIHDPCTPYLGLDMDQSLRGKIALVKSRSNLAATQDLLVAIDSVNRKLDTLTGELDDMSREKRHLAVAETISSSNRTNYSTGKAYDTTWDAQNTLCGAVTIGDLHLVKSLLEERQTSMPSVEVDGSTPYFGRPLVIAAGLGYLDIVRYLLEKGARASLVFRRDKQTTDETDTVNRDSDTRWQFWLVGLENTDPTSAPSALRAAVLGRHKHVLRELLLPEYGLASSKVEFLICLIAAARGDVEIVQMLLNVMEGEKLSDFRGLGQEMLWEAIRHDRKDVVQMLFDAGCVDANAFPYYPTRSLHGPLQWAAFLGKIDMMRFLLDRGADIHLNGLGRTGHSPVEGAAKSGQEEAVDLLLELGADPLLALRIAVKESQPRITKLVLDRFPDLLDRDDGQEGRLAMWHAVTRKNLRNITLLVERGVSLNDGYKESWEIPVNAAKDGKGQWVVDHLLSLGAHDTSEDVREEDCSLTTGLVQLEERTWQWVCKY